MWFDYLLGLLLNFFKLYGPRIIYSLIVLILGFWLIKRIKIFLDKRLQHRKSDPSLRHFLVSLLSISLKVLLLVSVASMLGIATTSFIAVLGAAGLAIGLALQGSLANFAGGVLILLFKPFKVGDYINAQGFEGTVKRIDIFNTTLTTIDNKTIIIPNGNLSNDAVVNFSKEPLRRVDLVFGISYDDDFRKAQSVLKSILDSHKLVLKDPESFVRVSELADSSVNFTVRAWVKKEDYWTVYFDLIEQVKSEFDKSRISIPYPQMDVHVKK